ncbi:MAG: hypothetical protein JSR46_01700 [Verrucomicrobia bacterium]|nr:hypothetical protein [Verrucomicrobiota bacterium]
MIFLKMAHDGIDLLPLQERIEQEVVKYPHNAAALLDSAALTFLKGSDATGAMEFVKGVNVLGQKRQQAAFEQSVFFTVRESAAPTLRVLALAAPGEVNCNAPIEFLLQNDDIETTFWYVLPDRQDEGAVPEHDIAVVISDLSDSSKETADRIQKMEQSWPKPLINRIENLQKFARDRFFSFAKGIAGIYIPETRVVSRTDAMPFPYPFIIRPLHSFGGHGLSKIEKQSDLESYLETHFESQFFTSPFIDYSSSDGLFRKYRIAVVDGKAFPVHMAINEKWALWYYSSGMLESEEKIAEEVNFLLNFDTSGLGKKYGAAIEQLAKKIGSEYFVLDCAETKTGELLIFEGGHDMVVHDMESPTRFPVKNEKMQELFRAFQTMLKDRYLCSIQKTGKRPSK